MAHLAASGLAALLPLAGAAAAQYVCPCAVPAPAPTEEREAFVDTQGGAWSLLCTNATPDGDFAWILEPAGSTPRVLGCSSFVDAENRALVIARADGSVAYFVHASLDGGTDDGAPWDAVVNVYRVATDEKLRLCLEFQGGTWVEGLNERRHTSSATFDALSPVDADTDCVPDAGFDELLTGLYAAPAPPLSALFEARVRVRARPAGLHRELCWDAGATSASLQVGDRVRLRTLSTSDLVSVDAALVASDTADGLVLDVVAPLAAVDGAPFATVLASSASASAASPVAVEVTGAEAFYDQLFAQHPGTPIDALGFSIQSDLGDAPGFAGSLAAVDLSPVPAVDLLALAPTGGVGTSVAAVTTLPFQSTVLGSTPVSALSGLAAEPFTGVLFASTGTMSGGLLGTLTTNPVAFAAIGPTGFAAVPGLAFAPGGVLFATVDTDGSGGSDSLATLDTTTGSGTLVGALLLDGATPVPGVDALAFDPRTRELFATTGFAFDGSPGDLLRIDTASAAVTVLGSLTESCTGTGLANTVAGLAFDSRGALLGSLGGGDGRLISIDVDARTYDVLGFAASGSVSDITVTAPGEAPARAYCSGKTNSLGCVPFIGTSGYASATATGAFALSANDVLPGEIGFLLYSTKKADLDFHGAKLCVKGPTRLLPGKQARRACTPCPGRLSRNFNKTVQSGADPRLTPGAVVRAQWRQRDPGDTFGFGDGLTDAVQFRIAP